MNPERHAIQLLPYRLAGHSEPPALRGHQRGLATLTVARRTKEISIRKALGATLTQAAGLVTREFALLVLLATLVAWPLAYLGLDAWLDGFAYRIAMPWWTFAIAGLGAILVALLTVGVHAVRAARLDPASTFRDE